MALSGELLDQSRAALREVGQDELSIYERLQYLLTAALASNYLGQIRLSQRNHDEAAQLLTEGLSAARRAQDRITKLVSIYDLALSSQERGDLVAPYHQIRMICVRASADAVWLQAGNLRRSVRSRSGAPVALRDDRWPQPWRGAPATVVDPEMAAGWPEKSPGRRRSSVSVSLSLFVPRVFGQQEDAGEGGCQRDEAGP